jgi:hypothetical protein
MESATGKTPHEVTLDMHEAAKRVLNGYYDGDGIPADFDRLEEAVIAFEAVHVVNGRL